MFAYSGLSEAQVKRLQEEFHVYMTKDGRMSISGINDSNVEYLAKAFHEVTKLRVSFFYILSLSLSFFPSFLLAFCCCSMSYVYF